MHAMQCAFAACSLFAAGGFSQVLLRVFSLFVFSCLLESSTWRITHVCRLLRYCACLWVHEL